MFQGIQQKRFTTICWANENDVVLFLTAILKTLADGVCISAVIFQNFFGTRKPLTVTLQLSTQDVFACSLRISRRDFEWRSTTTGAFCIFHVVHTY